MLLDPQQAEALPNPLEYYHYTGIQLAMAGSAPEMVDITASFYINDSVAAYRSDPRIGRIAEFDGLPQLPNVEAVRDKAVELSVVGIVPATEMENGLSTETTKLLQGFAMGLHNGGMTESRIHRTFAHGLGDALAPTFGMPVFVDDGGKHPGAVYYEWNVRQEDTEKMSVGHKVAAVMAVAGFAAVMGAVWARGEIKDRLGR